MKIKLPYIYNQQDSRWQKVTLGFNDNPAFDLGNYGCLVTCLAMTCQYFGRAIDPFFLNDKLKEVRGFQEKTGLYIWNSLAKAFPEIGEKKTDTPQLLNDDQINEIKSHIDRGYPVMILLDVNPKDADLDYHYVLIVDYDPANENNFTIADPIGGRIHSLTDYLGWFKPSARRTIEQYILLTGPKPVITTDSMIVRIEDNERNVTKATNYDNVIKYLFEAGHLSDPEPMRTDAERVKNIIAGIKSQVTTYRDASTKAAEDLKKATVEVDNRIEQVRRKEQELLEQDKAHKEELKALNDVYSTPLKLREQYEGTILKLREQVDQAMREKGEALKQLAVCQTKDSNPLPGILTSGLIEKIIQLLLKKI